MWRCRHKGGVRRRAKRLGISTRLIKTWSEDASDRNRYPVPQFVLSAGSRSIESRTPTTPTDGRIVRTRACEFCEWKWWTLQYPETNVDPAKYIVRIPKFSLGRAKNIQIVSTDA